MADVEEISGGSGSSVGVYAAVVAVLAALVVISVIVVVAVILVRRFKVIDLYKRRVVREGISNAVYSNTEMGAIQLGSINADLYDYPTLSDVDTKHPFSYPPLEFYSTSDYSEVIHLSHSNDDYSTIMDKAHSNASGPSEYESPYYMPASKEEELYSQLRKEKIKAIPKEEIEIAESLGRGEFGDVARGYWNLADYAVSVALKTLSGTQDLDARTKLLQEAAIMSQFKHPNVVKLFGIVSDDHQLMLVTELLSKGDLHQFLQSMRPDPGELVSPQTPSMLLNFSQQIAVGLQYLSRKNFVHRDLAARNVLISDNNICKISDFGMARNLIEDDYYMSQGGKIPLKWTAPEALVYRKYSSASDVWSYGCVLYEIWSIGCKPFENTSNQEVLVQIESGYRLPPPPGCPKILYDLMIRCWHPESSARPTVNEIILALMENEETVLRVPAEDAATNSMASVLGAPLEAGQKMYPHLQEVYCSTQTSTL